MIKTPFDLIQALRSWFHAKDAAIFTGGRDIDTGGGDVVVGAGTVDGVDVGAHAGSANAHHNQSHVLATGSALGGDHTISGASSGEVLRATGSTAARFDQLAHADLGSVGVNDHHNQSHVLATGSALGGDHTISGAADGQVLRAYSSTGARFDPLSDGDIPSSIARDSEVTSSISTHSGSSDHDGRYFQESEFSSNPGSSSKPLESSAAGVLTLVQLVGTSTGISLVANGSVRIDGSGVLILTERGAPATPGSGYGYLYVSTTGVLRFKNDAGVDTAIAP